MAARTFLATEASWADEMDTALARTALARPSRRVWYSCSLVMWSLRSLQVASSRQAGPDSEDWHNKR
eukprot:scaffold606683_cov33-Prasinocladus_malaysianus.AAC.1